MERTETEYIESLLTNNDLAVEKALVAIYHRQTVDEKLTNETTDHNGMGFSQHHASIGSYYARYLLDNKHLTGRHLATGRKIALRYVNQLVSIAQEVVAIEQKYVAEERAAIQEFN